MAVGGFGAVLALVVMFSNVSCKTGLRRSQNYRTVREPGYVLKQVRIFDGGCSRFSPCERSMAGHEDAGNGQWIEGLFTKQPGYY